MIIGKINTNDKIVKFNLDIKCTKCGISVPGGIKTSQNYYDTIPFLQEIEQFKKNYLCGKCRDTKRISEKNI